MQVKRTLSNQGFTIMETIVAIAIFGVLTIGVTQIVSMLLTNKQNVAAEIEYLDTVNNLSQIVNDAQSCTSSLQGQADTGNVRIIEPSSVPPKTLVETGSLLKGWTVKRVALVDTQTLVGTKKIAKLRFEVERATGSGIQGMMRTREFLVRINSGATNVVESCWGANANAETSCEEIGGVYDPAASPPCQLTGRLAAQSCTSPQVASGFDTNGRIICASPPPVATPPPVVVPVGCAGKSATCTWSNNGRTGRVHAKCDDTGKMFVRAEMMCNGQLRDSGWVAGTTTRSCLSCVIKTNSCAIADGSSFASVVGTGGGSYKLGGSCTTPLN